MDINKYIDYAVLKPNLSFKEMGKECLVAAINEYYSICVNPCKIGDVASVFSDQQAFDITPKVSCVLNFPLGTSSVESIRKDLTIADKYTDEFDIVLPLFLIADKEWDLLSRWCKDVRERTRKPIKGIIEIGYWYDLKIVKALVEILIDSKWDFIKTCTGFGPRGVELGDIELLKKLCKDDIKIKASAGIKDKKFAEQLINAGADRIGTSSII